MPRSLGQLWLPILAPKVHNIPASALAKSTTLGAPELIMEGNQLRERVTPTGSRAVLT